MDVALLHNPGAGNRDFSRERLVAMLRDAGLQPHYFSLNADPVDPAAFSTGEFVIVAGGDGSIRHAALRLAHTGRALAPLPIGTANNIAAALGLHAPTERLIAGLAHPRHVAVDLGLARGPWGERRFIEGVGLGLIAHSMAILESIDGVSAHEPGQRADRLHRDLSVFLTLAHEMKPLSLAAQIDLRSTRNELLLLEILNIARAGPGIELASHADVSDGLLDVISVTEHERESLKNKLRQHLGGQLSGPIFTSQKARHVHVRAGDCDVRIDDALVRRRSGQSPAPEFEINIAVDPAALAVVLPTI